MRVLVMLGCAALATACEPLIGADFGPYELGASASGTSAGGGGSGGGGSGGGGGGMCVAMENCATEADDDCAGDGNQSCGAWVESWLVNQNGNDTPQEIMSGMIATSSEALTVGGFRGTLTQGNVTSSAFAGIVTRATAGTASLDLVRTVRRSGDVGFSDVAARPGGGYVVSGAYWGDPSDMEPFNMLLPPRAALTALVALFDGDDSPGSFVAGPGSSESFATAVAAGPNGEVGVLGFTSEALTAFGISDAPTNRQFFIARLAPQLQEDWSTLLSNSGVANTCGMASEYQTETSLRVAFGSDGALWAAGGFCGEIETDNALLMGQRDVFILRKGPGGDDLVGLAAGDGLERGHHIARAIAPTPDGGALVAGEFDYQITLGTQPVLESFGGGGRDLFVAKLSSTLTVDWARRYGGSGFETARDLAIAPDGTLYLAGHFNGLTDLGAGPVGVDDGVERVFWMRLDAEGNPIHSHVHGGASGNAMTHGARRIAVTADSVWLAGYIHGEIALGRGAAGTLSAQFPSGFLARFAP